MRNEEKAKAFEVLLEGSKYFVLNMNDTFSFACGDSEEMPTEDFGLMAPLIAKYSHDALTAYAAVRRGAEPIDCRCNHKNERYYAAKKEIERLKAEHPNFCRKEDL
jgi:hypothetical protein